MQAAQEGQDELYDELEQLIAEDEMADMVDAGVGSISVPSGQKQPA